MRVNDRTKFNPILFFTKIGSFLFPIAFLTSLGITIWAGSQSTPQWEYPAWSDDANSALIFGTFASLFYSVFHSDIRQWWAETGVKGLKEGASERLTGIGNVFRKFGSWLMRDEYQEKKASGDA